MEIKIRLRKCAFIFDNTHKTYYYGTREQIANEKRIEKEIRGYYDNPEKCAEWINAEMHEDGDISIIVDGSLHYLNALQVAEIAGFDWHIINNRKEVDPATLTAPGFVSPWGHGHFYHNKLKSLNFELFTGADELGYIRFHFKNNRVCFIVSKSGEIYSSGEHGQHKPLSKKEIIARLGAESSTAKKAINAALDAIIAA